MKRHKQTKMHIENAKIHRVQKQKRPMRKQKRSVKMPIENAKNRGVPSSWWFVVVQAHTRCVTKSTTNIVYVYVCVWLCATD